MKNTYLYVLYQQNKILFFFIFLFLLGQSFFTYKGVETLPFFNYGMYSAPAAPRVIFTKNILSSDTARIKQRELPNYSPAFLEYQLNYYQKSLKNNSFDPIVNTISNRFGKKTAMSLYLESKLCNKKLATEKFLPWLSGYIYKNNLIFEQQKYRFIDGKFRKIN